MHNVVILVGAVHTKLLLNTDVQKAVEDNPWAIHCVSVKTESKKVMVVARIVQDLLHKRLIFPEKSIYCTAQHYTFLPQLMDALSKYKYSYQLLIPTDFTEQYAVIKALQEDQTFIETYPRNIYKEEYHYFYIHIEGSKVVFGLSTTPVTGVNWSVHYPSTKVLISIFNYLVIRYRAIYRNEVVHWVDDVSQFNDICLSANLLLDCDYIGDGGMAFLYPE